MAQGAPAGNWSGGLHGNWVLWVVYLNGAGGRVEVMVYVAAAQVAGWLGALKMNFLIWKEP